MPDSTAIASTLSSVRTGRWVRLAKISLFNTRNQFIAPAPCVRPRPPSTVSRVTRISQMHLEWAMSAAALIAGLLFCLSAVLDAFQTIILPRRPTGRFRITRLFYVLTWKPWAALARHTRNPKVRDQIYSTFGPGSLLLLLVVWALLLIAGFGLLFFSLRTPFEDAMAAPTALARLRTDLYVSGTT